MMIVLSQLQESFCTKPLGFDEALMVAVAAHQGQVNKFNGEPYILHVLRVISHVRRQSTESDELLSVAALHDVVEDTRIGMNYLLQMGFRRTVVDAVLSVTHYKEIETYEEFITRASQNVLGRCVKIADLRDHLSRPEPRPGMHDKYAKALLDLKYA
jgi:(p)ppGpp synthase/HD superfamily hydrolase